MNDAQKRWSLTVPGARQHFLNLNRIEHVGWKDLMPQPHAASANGAMPADAPGLPRAALNRQGRFTAFKRGSTFPMPVSWLMLIVIKINDVDRRAVEGDASGWLTGPSRSNPPENSQKREALAA